MNLNKKGFANIVLIVVIVAIIAVGGYFVFSKKSPQVVQQTTTTTPNPTPTPTPTSTVTPASNTSTNSQKPSQLLVPTVNLYSLIFNSNSVCVIGSDEGQCTVLQSNFNGGENVDVDGLQGTLRKGPDNSWSFISTAKISGSNIIVKKLILNDNFVMNGNLVQDLSKPGQKAWNLIFRPYIGDSVNQDPNRSTSTIPLKFDEKSSCGDTGKINCDSYALHQNDWVFVRGIKYNGVLIVRMLTIPAIAPSTLPR